MREATLTTTNGPLVASVLVVRDSWGDIAHVFVDPRRRPGGWSYDQCVRAMQAAVMDGRVVAS